MSAIDIPDYYERGHPVLEIGLDDVEYVVFNMQPYSQAGVGGSQEYCLIANVVREITGADYVEVDFFRKPGHEIRGVAVTRHGDCPLVKWSLPEETARCAADFDHTFEECDVTREEALAWLTARSR